MEYGGVKGTTPPSGTIVQRQNKLCKEINEEQTIKSVEMGINSSDRYKLEIQNIQTNMVEYVYIPKKWGEGGHSISYLRVLAITDSLSKANNN